MKFLTLIHGRRDLRDLTDQQLIDLFRKKKEDIIIDEFFDRYIHLVFAVCIRFLKDEEQSRDAAMEIFESLEEKLLNYDIRNFKSWFYQVIQNHCRLIIRSNKKFMIERNIQNFDNTFVENDPVLNHDDEEKINIQLIGSLVKNLKECQRICIEMMYFQNKSYRQISAETGYSEKAVKSYIQNGKRNLKKWMIEQNGQRNEI
ncbi:MAG: sigma-70 family RNA polymerase sigma factor [Bacteroidales bacterium]|nr:sigma-70 family RNA polymerase sigma factor [Bacteroidales bacterium]